MSDVRVSLESPLCVALDSTDRSEILDVARATAADVGMFKVGLTAFTSGGGDLVAELATTRPVFVDLKLHDIPAQVHGAVVAIEALGASVTTVHATGGRDMIAAAVDAAEGMAVVAVTILTSLDAANLSDIGLEGPVEDAVMRLAELALGAGADGLVCSPLEVAAIRARFGSRAEGGPLVIVPGIRPREMQGDDQKRTMPATEAVQAGADVVVVGRPITAAPDPAAAARALREEMG